jgi:EmrB/QacA subfamily drug resistance transporter
VSPSTSTTSRLKWLAFAAAVAAAVMDLLDSTIAQVAAPSIRRDLGGSYAVIEWVTAAYTLAMAVGLLTGGRLGDMFGRKRVLLVGVGAFLVASVGCAAAGTPGELIAARAAQGFAGAVMLPQVFGLIRDLFAPEEMGKAFGVYGPAMGLAAMLGPVVSGGLISADVLGTGWRMIFLVNLPIGAFTLLAGARYLPSVAPESRGTRLDLPGVALAGVGMLMLVYPLAQGHEAGWPAWMIGLLVASVPVLVGFAAHELRRSRAGRVPLVEPGIFKRRAYTAGVVFDLVFIGSLAGIVLIFNVFLQAGLGFTPWHSALTTAPWALGAFFGSAVGGITMAKLGRKVLHAGLVIEAVGLLALVAVLQAAGGHVGSLELLAPMIVGGAGMGMVFVPLFDIVMAGVEPRQIGSASAVLQAINGLGMSLGVAALGSVFFGIAGAGHIHGFVIAAQWTALITVGLLTVAFVIAFWMPRRAREMGVVGASEVVVGSEATVGSEAAIAA